MEADRESEAIETRLKVIGCDLSTQPLTSWMKASRLLVVVKCRDAFVALDPL